MYRPPFLLLTVALMLSSPSLPSQTKPSAVTPSPPASGALIVPDSVRQMPVPAKDRRTAAEEEPTAAPRRAEPPASRRFEVEMAKCSVAPPAARDTCIRDVHAARAAGLYRD